MGKFDGRYLFGNCTIVVACDTTVQNAPYLEVAVIMEAEDGDA